MCAATTAATSAPVVDAVGVGLQAAFNCLRPAVHRCFLGNLIFGTLGSAPAAFDFSVAPTAAAVLRCRWRFLSTHSKNWRFLAEILRR